MSSKTFSTLCSIEHLTRAWNDVKAKKAGGGVDGENIATFEVNLEKNLRTTGEPCRQTSAAIEPSKLTSYNQK